MLFKKEVGYGWLLPFFVFWTSVWAFEGTLSAFHTKKFCLNERPLRESNMQLTLGESGFLPVRSFFSVLFALSQAVRSRLIRLGDFKCISMKLLAFPICTCKFLIFHPL